VADTGNKRIEVFNTRGKYLFSWGTAGTGTGQFDEPSSLAIGPDATIYVADFWNQRIQAFTTTGRFVRSWQVPDWPPHSYDEPYLAVDRSTGRVFAVDPQQRQILEFSSSGALLGTVGTAQLSLPIGVAVVPGGRLVVSDATANHLDVFKLQAPQGSRALGSPQPTLPQLQKAKKG
jgi:DNA-binding beta-propeller fold protein YncE